MVHIDPTPDARNYFFPFCVISKHGRACRIIKLINAVRLNIFFVLKTTLSLDKILNGKPMSIPPPYASHKTATHCLIARNYILDRARKNVPIVRYARCEGWSIIERKMFSPFRLLECFLKNMFLLPKSESCFLSLGYV